MKAEITLDPNGNGLLQVRAETELESYALYKWSQENIVVKESKINENLVINIHIEE